MDVERRQREGYRSRLMEENEVPDWVYPENSAHKPRGNRSLDNESIKVSGKRLRKEVFYADLLSDVQWMKAVESGEDLSKIAARGKWREHPFDAYESASDDAVGQSMSEQRNMSRSTVSESGSDDTWSRTPKKFKTGFLCCLIKMKMRVKVMVIPAAGKKTLLPGGPASAQAMASPIQHQM